MTAPNTETKPPAGSLVLKDLGLEVGGQTLLREANRVLPGHGMTVIFGRSGTGKTTLLRALAQLAPYSGQILLGEKPTSEFSPQDLRRKIQYLHQEPSLFPGTVRYNLQLPFSFKASSEAAPDDTIFDQHLQALGLAGDILDQEAARLSGGEKQRVALVRSLLLEPDFLLLDEPTSAMDVASEERTLQVLREMAPVTGVILVSHSVQLITTADRALLMGDGSLKEITEELDRQAVQKLVEDNGSTKTGTER